MAHVLAKDLREAVLQAAITGKLSKQDINDTSVIETLHKCENDKKKAIKDGKFRKEAFRSPVINDELPEIPPHWKWAYISDVTLFQEGPGILAVDFCDKGIPLIRIAGMQTDEVQLIGCNFLSPEKVEQKWKHYKLDKGDILISTSASMDKICEVYEEAEGAIPYTGQIRFKMYGNISKEYFKIFVKSPYYSKQISEQEAGGMIKHYGPTHLKKMYIAIPPIEEQTRIVTKVDELMAKIDEYEKLEKELTELKQKFPGEMRESISYYAYQGKMNTSEKEDSSVNRLLNQIKNKKKEKISSGILKEEKPLPEIKDSELPYEIPKNWEWVRFGDYCEKVTDQVASGSFKSLRENVSSLKTKDYALMVKTADFANNFTQDLTYTDKHGYDFLKNSNLFGGELILSNIGSIGKVFIVPNLNIPMTLAPNSIMLRFTDENLRDYVYRYLTSPVGYNQLMSITSGTAMKKFNKTDFKKLIIPVPPIEEQQRIVEKLDQLLPMCDELVNLC